MVPLFGHRICRGAPNPNPYAAGMRFRVCLTAVVLFLAGCGADSPRPTASTDPHGNSGHFKSGLGTPQLAKGLLAKGLGCFLPNELVVADQTSEWGLATSVGWISICAGRVPDRPSSGVIFIARTPGQNALIKVPGSGAITLTEAPESRRTFLTASKRGVLRFTSENGVSGTLHLQNDSITLDG